jgi:hypothetical protein
VAGAFNLAGISNTVGGGNKPGTDGRFPNLLKRGGWPTELGLPFTGTSAREAAPFLSAFRRASPELFERLGIDDACAVELSVTRPNVFASPRAYLLDLRVFVNRTALL